VRRIEVDITPEPSDSERAALAAFISGEEDASSSEDGSAWRRAALEEAVGADEGYGLAPSV
jgi:hypothetical protein